MMDNTLGFVIWGLVSLGVGGLGVFLLVKRKKNQRDAEESQAWLSVYGQVTDVGVKVDGDADTGKYRYMPVVNYVYAVDSKIYDGSKINFGRRPIFNSQREADDFLRQYPPNEDVEVFYHPLQPDKAVLRRELLGGKANSITGVVLIVVMLQMIAALVFMILWF